MNIYKLEDNAAPKKTYPVGEIIYSVLEWTDEHCIGRTKLRNTTKEPADRASGQRGGVLSH
ncbi:unnamed protein product [Ceratitis capitata]|uniref:(Mediterranean fruit fly) hypothetical protein n=1 Tax=Ceratitis capitata TaxID=7213 RepID=A0A811UE46_CERCA|nr:unnamed protein product [Ceratitis capitata]